MASLRATHEGYQYQDIVSAYFYAQSLIEPTESIDIDTKRFPLDIFDDLSVSASSGVTRRQIKHSTNTTAAFEVQDLITDRKRLRIDKVVKSILSGDPKWDHRICATWTVPLDDSRLALVSSAAERTFPTSAAACFTLNVDWFWPEGGQLRQEMLQDAFAEISRAEFVSALNRLVLELALPRMSANLRRPGPLERILIKTLADDIGIGRYPNDGLNPVDSAAHLVFLATAARSGHAVPLNAIPFELQLRTDYGAVPQRFPVRNDEEVWLSDTIEELKTRVLQQPRTLVVGSPGSGKSWLLTKVADELQDAGHHVARHYCFISVGDELAPKRILRDVLFGNLTAALKQSMPALGKVQRPILAAGPLEFAELIGKAVQIAEGKRVIVFVDGLDHIARIRSLHNSIAEADTQIVDELSNLPLPQGASLVLGSQPGTHLQPLGALFNEFPVPPWPIVAVGRLATYMGIWTALQESGLALHAKETLQVLFRRSNGNPLYVWYACKELLGALSSGEAVLPVVVLEALPGHDLELVDYYKHLLTGSDAIAHRIAEILACIDFGMSKEQLEEALGPAMRPLVSDGLMALHPVLDLTAAQGIRIYHESFRRFILRELENRPAGVAECLAPIITWLRGRGFFDDSLAFRYLIPSLQRSKLFGEIAELLTSDFSFRAIFSGEPLEATIRNIELVAWMAIHEKNYALIAVAAETRKMVSTAFDHIEANLTLFGEALAAVFGINILVDRLSFDGHRSFPREPGLLLCSLCDSFGAVPPWPSYLVKDKIGEQDRLSDSAEVAVFLGRLRISGLGAFEEAISNYILTQESLESQYQRGVLRAVASVGGIAIFEMLVQDERLAQEVKARLKLVLAQDRLVNGKSQEARALANDAATVTNDPLLLFESFEIGSDTNLIASRLGTTAELTLEAAPIRTDPNESELLRRWLALVFLHAAYDKDSLESIKIASSADSWYTAWQHFAIALARISAEPLLAPEERGQRVLAELRALANHKGTFAGTPRACDLYPFHIAILDSFRRAIRMIHESQHWEDSIECLREISQATTTYLSGDLHPSGPITIFAIADLLTDYLDVPGRGSKVIDVLREMADRGEASRMYFGDLASQFMRIAAACAKLGNANEATRAWEKASKYLCGYGLRKDITVWETFTSAPVLAKALPERALEIFARSQPLCERVLHCTDGRETNHAPVAWLSALAEVFPERAFALVGLAVTRDGGDRNWKCDAALRDLLDLHTEKLDPIIAFFLDAITGFQASTKRSPQRRVYLAEMIRSLPEIARDVIRLVHAGLLHDPESPDSASLFELQGYAALVNLELPGKPTEASSKKSHSIDSVDDSDLPKSRLQFAKPSLRTQLGSSPLEIMVQIQRIAWNQLGRHYQDHLVNVLGYRLSEWLDGGDTENPTRILRFLHKELRYTSASTILEDLGEGFQRAGHTKTAAICFSLSYARHGHEWYGTPAQKDLQLLNRAIELEPVVAEQTVLQATGDRFGSDWTLLGVPTRLVHLALALGKNEEAFATWSGATSVIASRLLGESPSWSTWESCDDSSLPQLKLDEAATLALLSYISHPDVYRKRTAIAGLYWMLSNDHAAITNGLRSRLSINTTIAQTSVILEAIDTVSQANAALDPGITELLREYLAVPFFLSSRLAYRLLLRTDPGASLQPRMIDLPSTLTESRRIPPWLVDARLETISETWPEFSRLVARAFQSDFRDNIEYVERARQQFKNSLDNVHPERPEDPIARWDTEVYEYSFDRVLQHIPSVLAKRGEWDAFRAASIIKSCGNGVHIHGRIWCSRIRRPTMETPSQRVAELSEFERCRDDDQFCDWLRIGLWEEETLLGDHRADARSRIVRAFLGAAFLMPGEVVPPEVSMPFSPCDWRDAWLDNAELPLLRRMHGPLVLFAMSEGYCGDFPVLAIPGTVRSRLGLSFSNKIGPLQCVDAKGDPALVYRCWWSLRLRERISNAYPYVVGSELIVRPDIFERLSDCSVHQLRPVFMNDVETLSPRNAP